MMARIDNTVELKITNLKNNPPYPFALQCQLRWSKNVQDERGAPYQILLGSGDHRYCILLALGIYLELWIESGEGLHSEHVFCAPNERPKQVNSACSSALRTYVFKAEDFVLADNSQPIGMHSLRKLPATYAQCNNCTQDEIEIRGRWRTQTKQRVSMWYVSTDLLYQDAKVASKLCMGGPVKYTAREGANVTNAWLLQNVVPHIAQRFSEQFATTLAFPILWACYNDQCSTPIPHTMKNRVWAAYEMV